VRVTHPFHPLSGRQLVCVGERYNRYGKRLLLRIDDEATCTVPPQWTDAAAPDPDVALGEGRSLLRLADLLELAALVARLRQSAPKGSASRKQNYAAIVKTTMPRRPGK
jgi:hypothetical protein